MLWTCAFYFFHANIMSLRSAVVAVAQLVESRIVIPVVVGSSPISHPNYFIANIDEPAYSGLFYCPKIKQSRPLTIKGLLYH